MERLLEGITSDTVQKYAKHAASALAFFFMTYIASHPQEAEDQDFLEYIVDRVTSFFISPSDQHRSTIQMALNPV